MQFLKLPKRCCSVPTWKQPDLVFGHLCNNLVPVFYASMVKAQNEYLYIHKYSPIIAEKNWLKALYFANKESLVRLAIGSLYNLDKLPIFNSVPYLHSRENNLFSLPIQLWTLCKVRLPRYEYAEMLLETTVAQIK